MKIKRRESNESEKNENEIDVEKNAINDDDGETMRDNHHLKSFYQS